MKIPSLVVDGTLDNSEHSTALQLLKQLAMVNQDWIIWKRMYCSVQ